MLWRKRVIAIAAEYPDVELSHMYVDNAAMQLVRNPKQVHLLAYFFFIPFLRHESKTRKYFNLQSQINIYCSSTRS